MNRLLLYCHRAGLGVALACGLAGSGVDGRVYGDESATSPAAIPFVEVSDISEPIVFDKHVFPILSAKCLTCHDREGGLAEGDLDVATVEALFVGGKKGPALVKEKAAESLLVRLASRAEKPIMPPKNEEPLTPRELTILKLWIDQGAKPGENLTPAAMKEGAVELGTLPPGVHPVYSLAMDPAGSTLIAGRANQVFVYDLPSGGLRAQLTGHQDIVQSVALSPDGAWIAAGGYRLVKLWQVPQGKEIRSLAGHESTVRAIAVHPVAGLVVTASEDQSVRLWSLAIGQPLRQLVGHAGPVHSLALSADCSLLATACADKLVRLYQTTSGRLLTSLVGHGDQVLSVAISPDKKWLASAGVDQSVRLWDLAAILASLAPAAGGARAVATPAAPPVPEARVLPGHAKPVQRVLFAGPSLISAADDGAIFVWNVADGAKAREIQHGAAVHALALSADQSRLASAGADHMVKIWSLADGSLQQTLSGHGGPVLSAAFSPDGTALAAGVADNSIRVWQLADSKLLYTMAGHAGPVHAVAFATDARTLVSASADKTIKIWEAAGAWGDSIDLADFAERVLAVDFSPDSKRLVTGGGVPAASGEVTIWDLEKRERVLALDHPHSDTVFGVSFSPDGKLIASAAGDKFLKVHDGQSGAAVKSFEGHTGHVLCVGWKHDGTQLATGGADNVVKLWSLESGEQIRTIGGHGKQVTGLKWIGGTAQLVTSSGDRQARLINADDGKIPRGFGGATEYLYAIAASADGRLVAAGAQDGKIFVWNGADGKLLLTLDVPRTVETAEVTK